MRAAQSPRKTNPRNQRRMLLHFETKMRNAPASKFLQQLDYKSLPVTNAKFVGAAQIQRETVGEGNRQRQLKPMFGKVFVVVAHVGDKHRVVSPVLDRVTHINIRTCAERA